jgi:transposase
MRWSRDSRGSARSRQLPALAEYVAVRPLNDYRQSGRDPRFFASLAKVRQEGMLPWRGKFHRCRPSYQWTWQKRTGIGFAGILRLVPPKTFYRSMRDRESLAHVRFSRDSPINTKTKGLAKRCLTAGIRRLSTTACLDFGLWTRQIVAALITQKFGIRLGVTAVGRLLAELDITPQKPLRRAYERDPVAIKQWTTAVFPRLRARAQRSGAKIFFLDEAGVRSDQCWGEPGGVRCKTPEVATSGQRQSVSAISAVNARGAFWYAIYAQRLNATAFIGLLANFLRRRTGKVLLVLDGHPAHTAKAVAHYVQSLRRRLELHYLPGYAPELNPDEFVWNHLERQGVSKTPLRHGESLRSRVHADLPPDLFSD